MKWLGSGLVIALTLLGAGCKTNPSEHKTARTAKTKPASAEKLSVSNSIPELDDKEIAKRADAFAHYATGITFELNEKSDDALNEFYKSAIANPANESLVIELATRLADKKQTDRAAEILEKSASRKDATGAVFATLSYVQLHAGKTNAAMQSAQSAIKRSPSLLQGYEALSNVYSSLDKSDEALKVLDRAASQIKPEAPQLITLAEFYSRYAKLHPKQKQSIAPRAKELLKRADALDPKGVMWRQKLADNYSYFGEPGRATEIYSKLLANESEGDMEAWRDVYREKLANLYLGQNDKTNAAAQLEAIIRDNPTKYPHAYYILGTIAYDQKKFTNAAEYFQKTILLNPDVEQAYYDLAATQINIDQPNRALATLDKAQTKFKENFVNEYFSAVAYNKLKKFSEAAKHYMAAEMLAKTSDSNRLDQTFYFQAGASFERSKNYPEAERYFLKALEKAPNDAETLNYLGYMWVERGTNFARAREMIEKAVKLEPKNPAYLDSLGWVLFKMNDAEHALTYIQKAIQYSEQPDPDVYDHLGDIYQALHQPEKAHDAWKKSLSIQPSDDIKKKLGSTL